MTPSAVFKLIKEKEVKFADLRFTDTRGKEQHVTIPARLVDEELFRDGKILGGDAYLFYTGTYTVKDDTFRGEVLVQRHTSSPDANPLFGAPSPVGIGVTGTFTDTRGTMSGTALVGKASQIFGATLRKLADID